MRDFKKNGKKIGKGFLFCLILCLIFVGMSKQMEKALMANDNLAHSRNKSIFRIKREPENTIDVLVVGDSLSYSSVSPMELWRNHGIASYVCGQSGQKIQEAYHILETALAAQNPKVVVLETDELFRANKGMGALKELIAEWGNYYIPIIRNHDIWKSFLVDKQYPEENYKGFAFRCEINPYTKGEYMKETEKMVEIPELVQRYMEKIITLCKEKGAQLLLVSTPSPANYNYSKYNTLVKYAQEQSLDYLDMNLKLDELKIDWKTDSLDRGDHLNLSGAEKVSRYLGTFLKSKYELPDHRGENAYREWQKESEEYEKKAQENLKQMFYNKDK